MDEEDLTVSDEFAVDCGGYLAVVVRADVGEDRMPLLRRRLNGGHLADTGERHLEGARDGSCGHGEHVDGCAQGLDVLLVLHAETLLLIDNEEAQILEADLGGEHAVRPDDDVDRAVRESLEGALGLGVGLESGESGHLHGERRIALGEGAEVLLHQQGRGHEHRHLLAILHGLEGSTDRDLGLAVAHVTADDPVHGHGALHVRLDLIDARELIRRLDEGEGVLELALPRTVGGEAVSRRRLPLGIEAHEFIRDLSHRAASASLGALPVGSAEFAECRCLAADIARHLVELIRGDVETVGWLTPAGCGVLDDEVLAGRVRDGSLRHLDVAADPMLLVYDEVAGHQLQRVDGATPSRGHPRGIAHRRALPEEVGLGHQDDAAVR